MAPRSRGQLQPAVLRNPPGLPGAPADHAAAVDLAWLTSVTKSSLTHPTVTVRRPLTGPHRRRFGNWVGWRFARVPFPDDVVRAVLDPAYHVRDRLMASYAKAGESGRVAALEARTVGACTAWYARMQEANVTLLGRITPESLTVAGFVEPDGGVHVEDLERGRAKLEAAVRKRLQHEAPNREFGVAVKLRSFDNMRASDAETFSLLMR